MFYYYILLKIEERISGVSPDDRNVKFTIRYYDLEMVVFYFIYKKFNNHVNYL